MKKILFLCSFLVALRLGAAIPQVQTNMEFAGLKLHLTKAAKTKIQTEVNKLHKSNHFFNQYVKKADLFFPVIEQVFEEENFPKDFKYLIIQESGFKADAVSSSNAVGYWQFKAGTAKEVGLRVDHTIDERKNIVAASRGAAKYMSKINLKTKNWVYALLAYNRGPGGVQSHVKEKYVGASKMEIDRNMHWYVIKMLAHKVAYEPFVGRSTPELMLIQDLNQGGKTIKKVAKSYGLQSTDLEFYNKWIGAQRKIPTDRTYVVVVPVPYQEQNVTAEVPRTTDKTHTQKNDDAPEEVVYIEVPKQVRAEPRPQVTNFKKNHSYRVNGIDVLTAANGDNSARLAIKGEITKKKFLRYNEMKSFEELIPGEHYFLKKKKRKAKVAYHTVKAGESQWSISQEYGITTLALRTKNHLERTEALVPGRVLWLKQVRPESVPVQFNKNAQPKSVHVEEPNEQSISVDKESVASELDEVDTPKVDPEIEIAGSHQVGQGESLYAVAKRYGVTVEDLKAANGLSSNELSIGQVLNIPSNAALQTTTPESEVVEEVEVYETQKKYHKVVAGESLFSIAKMYGVTVEALKKVNQLRSNDLHVGQRLIIPGEDKEEKNSLSQEPEVIVHTVKAGDTMWAIAKKYGVSAQEIKKWNELSDFSLSIGQELKILK